MLTTLAPLALALALQAPPPRPGAAPAPAPAPEPAPAPAPAPADMGAPPAPPPAAAPAAGASGFGTQGQIAVTSQLSLSIGETWVKPPKGSSTSSFTASVTPSADYFVAPHISLGGYVAFSRTSSSISSGTSSTTVSITGIGVGARGGYAIDLAPNMALWLQLQLGYNHMSVSSGGGSAYQVPLSVLAPILYMPVPHFFIGVGPYFSTQLISKATVSGTTGDSTKTTSLALGSVVGGYF